MRPMSTRPLGVETKKITHFSPSSTTERKDSVGPARRSSGGFGVTLAP